MLSAEEVEAQAAEAGRSRQRQQQRSGLQEMQTIGQPNNGMQHDPAAQSDDRPRNAGCLLLGPALDLDHEWMARTAAIGNAACNEPFSRTQRAHEHIRITAKQAAMLRHPNAKQATSSCRRRTVNTCNLRRSSANLASACPTCIQLAMSKETPVCWRNRERRFTEGPQAFKQTPHSDHSPQAQ